jgi:hypothetical protein
MQRSTRQEAEGGAVPQSGMKAMEPEGLMELHVFPDADDLHDAPLFLLSLTLNSVGVKGRVSYLRR